MALHRLTWWVTLGTAGCLLTLAGCGQQAVGGAPSAATTQQMSVPASRKAGHPRTVRIRRGGISVRVPRAWRAAVTLTITSTTGINAMDLLPLTPNTTHSLVSSTDRSPWFAEALATDTLQLTEVTAAGRYDSLRIAIPAGASATTIHQVEASIVTPPVATATDIVSLLTQRLAHDPHAMTSVSRSQVGTENRWILVGGNPATAQEQFALFHTTNGGQSWSLAASSQNGSLSAGDFPNMLGTPTVFFWTPNDGLIAETSGFASGLMVYRTTDGGRQWAPVTVAHAGATPDSTVAPTIERRSSGALDLIVKLTSGLEFHAVSTDNGQIWTPVSP